MMQKRLQAVLRERWSMNNWRISSLNSDHYSRNTSGSNAAASIAHWSGVYSRSGGDVVRQRSIQVTVAGFSEAIKMRKRFRIPEDVTHILDNAVDRFESIVSQHKNRTRLSVVSESSMIYDKRQDSCAVSGAVPDGLVAVVTSPSRRPEWNLRTRCGEGSIGDWVQRWSFVQNAPHTLASSLLRGPAWRLPRPMSKVKLKSCIWAISRSSFFGNT